MEIDQLPENILEEIFAFVRRNANLRLVCKKIKNIIDNSTKLMKNECLIVDNVLNIDSSTIHQHYQKLELHDLSFEILNWMSNYQHKDRIKVIVLKCDADDLVISSSILQYILLNFNSMETIEFQLHDSEPIISSDNEIKLVPSELSKLETLHIGCWLDRPNSILDILSNIPTIKNLFIHDFEYLVFPNKVEWKLEKLIVPNMRERDIDHDNCNNFLKSQQSTLKKLILNDSFTHNADFIMRNLPNLESLKLEINDGDEIDDSRLLSNERLQRLIIDGIKIENLKNFTAILKHYNRIKYLSISYCYDDPVPDSFEWKFDHVTHLTLDRWNCFNILKNDFPCLKVLVLGLGDELPEYTPEISDGVSKNVEKLTISSRQYNFAFDLILYFKNLSQLNLSILEWRYDNQKSIVESINDLIDYEPQLKCFGLDKRYLPSKNLQTYEQLLSLINNKRIILKMYSRFLSMIAEDWGWEDSLHMAMSE